MDMNHAWQVLDWIAADGFSRLGVALGHFLWQGCVVALLYAVAAKALRGTSANARYVAGVTALLLMAACLPVTLVMIPPSQTVEEHGGDSPGPVAIAEEPSEPIREIATAAAPLLESTGPAPIRPLPSLPPTESAEAVPLTPAPVVPASEPPKEVPSPGILARLLPWASILYLCGVFAMLIRVALGLWGGRRLRRDCTPVAQTAILDLLGEHARRMGMRAAPVIAACGRVSVPLVVGVFRPMILIPTSLISGLTPGELEAVLVHELAHIRRFDPVVNVLQRLVEAVLFFHPAVWWVSRCVSVERENACDDLVLRTNCGRNEYASALVHMAELCVAGGSPAMIRSSALAATGKNGVQFRRRVLRVLRHDERTPVRLTAPGIVVSMLLIVALMLAPAAWRGMAWAEAKEAAEKKTPDPLNSSEEHKPVSMSAEQFARLSAEEQKALLVRVFQRRLEHSRNLYYELDQTFRGIENPDGKAGKPPKRLFANRCQYRHWRVGNSYRMDSKSYRNLDAAEPSSFSSIGVNAVEGLGRNISIPKDGKRPPSGDVQYPFDPAQGNLYLTWLSSNYSQDYPVPRDYLFPDLLEHKDDFKIEAPIAGDKVRLTVPWQPQWNGKRVFILDPQKGFLPVRCDSTFDCPLEDGRPMWRKERFTVEDSRLVGDVWMPVWLKTELRCSSGTDMMNANEAKVTRIEHGTAKSADIRVPFTEGMVIHDVVEGAIYTADAQGRPGPDLKLAPNWKHRPPKGWKRGDPGGTFSMASRFSPADRKKLGIAQGKIDDRRARQEETLNVLQSDSTVPLDDRIEAGLKILREYKVGENQPIWAGAIRELTEIGKPAVPKLIEELDRTERANTLRALAFILRGIDDPRAAPALIRAIPRTFQAGGGDYGLRIYDEPDLAKFMGSHDTGKGSGTGGFSYGAPRREIMPTLEKLTHHAIPHNDLRFAYFEGGAKQRCLQQEIFLKFARRWADWWSEHWRDVVENEDEAQLELIENSLDRYAEAIARAPKPSATAEFPRGPNVTVSELTLYTLIRSFKERPEEAFFDLDSGRHPRPSKAIIEASAEDKPSKKLLDWAEKEGVDLITVKVKNPDGEGANYAFWPVGTKVWRIDNDRYDKIKEELRRDKSFELPKPWQGPLTLIDEKTGKYEKKSTASYLFITKEGTCGRLRLKGPLYQEYGIGAGGSGGLRYDFVYEREGGEKGREDEKTTPDPLNSSDILIHGGVADEAGMPIAGAKLFLPLKYEDDKRLAKAVTDDSGLFTLRVPKAWIEPGASTMPGIIWCYAPKHRIAAVSAWKQLRGKSDAPIEIVLEPGTDTGFDVKNVQGDLIPGARVEPMRFNTRGFRDVAGIEHVPASLRKTVGANTDERGRVLLPAIGRDRLFSVQVTADGYGVQRFYLRCSAGQPAVRALRLRPTGRLEGRLVSDDKSLFKGLRVHVWQNESPQPSFPDENALAGGSAEVDENGRFVLSECAEGPIQLLIPIAEPGAWAPRIPENVEIKAGETTEVEVPFGRTVRVYGHVRLKESGVPAFDVIVSVSYGSTFQHNQVRTDIGGRFETNVLPGEIRQQIILAPKGHSSWTVGPSGHPTSIKVPAGAKTFDLPPLELVSPGKSREAIDKGMKADEFERGGRGRGRY